MNLYFDNAATSFPKPDSVTSSMINYMKNIGTSPGRGAYQKSLEASRSVYKCREEICDLFCFQNPENVIFTSGITSSINIILKSLLKEGDHVLTTSMEHNSVLRPLQSLKTSKEITYSIINADKNGFIKVSDLSNEIRHNTIAVIINHSSNIIGSIQSLKEIGMLCKKHNLFFIIDTAQSAGKSPINMMDIHCDALTFTSHKGLLGPQGLGGFIINNKLNEICTTFIEGGTGSLSESSLQPDFLPDKFESGTLNTTAIYGLLSSLEFIKNEGLLTIKKKEEYLTSKFIEGVLNIDELTFYGTRNTTERTPVVSITSSKFNNSELSFLLDRNYGIMTRTGLHCAPLAHKTIGSYPSGTTRFSFGYFQSDEDINYALSALNSIHQ